MIPISITRNLFITTLLIFITLLLISLTTITNTDPARLDAEDIQDAQPHAMTRILSALKSLVQLHPNDSEFEDVMVVHPSNWPVDPETLQEQLRKDLHKQMKAALRKTLRRDLAMSAHINPKNPERVFMLYVPENTPELQLDTSGGPGDIGLYVLHGTIPSTVRYDCRSTSMGTRHSCGIRSPEQGIYYVILRGNARYYGVSVTGAYHLAGHMFPSIAATPVGEIAGVRLEAPNS
ncbi:MAG TPA: PPC domain-containing protein [Gammaproteobacteria bacterium]|nr:PPC domain-containing protein [Gammaproteobacteria bacterium]